LVLSTITNCQICNREFKWNLWRWECEKCKRTLCTNCFTANFISPEKYRDFTFTTSNYFCIECAEKLTKEVVVSSLKDIKACYEAIFEAAYSLGHSGDLTLEAEIRDLVKNEGEKLVNAEKGLASSAISTAMKRGTEKGINDRCSEIEAEARRHGKNEALGIVSKMNLDRLKDSVTNHFAPKVLDSFFESFDKGFEEGLATLKERNEEILTIERERNRIQAEMVEEQKKQTMVKIAGTALKAVISCYNPVAGIVSSLAGETISQVSQAIIDD
jgi:hypothetical protein